MPAWVKDEAKWKQAKEIASKKFSESDGDRYWRYVAAIYKKLVGESFTGKGESIEKSIPSGGDSMVGYRDAISNKVADIAILQRQIKETNERIRQSAQHRLDVVQREIDATRKKIWSDEDAGKRYRDLVVERGYLHRVLGA